MTLYNNKIELLWKLKELIPYKRERTRLLQLIAEFSEKSYRRGVAQALRYERQGEKMANCFDSEELIERWRHRQPTYSMGLDGKKMPALKRFLKENPYMENFDK